MSCSTSTRWHPVTAGVGRFEDGRLAEIFLKRGSSGIAIDTFARDAAVAASLLFQHGCSPETLTARSDEQR